MPRLLGQLTLATGCFYWCVYCYLQGTLRGQKHINLYTNDWAQVQRELEASGPGVYNAGELADSLATWPPLLGTAIEWFLGQTDKTLLLVTKSGTLEGYQLLAHKPTPRVIISYSVNATDRARRWEKNAPAPDRRLVAANGLKAEGWSVRVRLDPVLLAARGDEGYQQTCEHIAFLDPARVTVGSLRPYGPVYHRLPADLREGLVLGPDGRLRYPLEWREHAYRRIAHWLGRQPALCKETRELWDALGPGWQPGPCNCTD